MIQKSSILFLFLLLLPGCTIIDWGKRTFNQGCQINPCIRIIPQQHIRSTRVYYEFTTLGIFDAMWLTNEVQKCHIKLFAKKNFISEEQAQEMLDKRCLENRDLISFYVQVHVPHVSNPLTNNPDSPWMVSLKVGDKTYLPYCLKKVILDREFKYLFGKYTSQFKTVYLLQFSAKDSDGENIIQPGIEYIGLCFHAMENIATLTWELDEDGKMLKNCSPQGYCINYNRSCEICEKKEINITCRENECI